MSSSFNTATDRRRHLYRLTNGILNAHSLHFIPISLLFLPLTFSASSAIKFYLSSGNHNNTDVNTMFDPFNLILIKTIFAFSHNLLHLKTLITIIAITCSVILPTVAGIALITFTTNQIIHGKHLTFSSTVKSLSNSYIPLLYTFIIGSIKLILLFLIFTLVPLAITQAAAAAALGLPFFLVSVFTNTIFSMALPIAMLYFITIWGSAPAITVMESKSGFEALLQSANQSTEFRHHSFSIVFITGFGVGTALAYSASAQNSVPFLILQVVCGLQSSLMILLYVVANAVLYVQCKVASGDEIVMKMVNGEDVKLVVNDDINYNVIDHQLAKEDTNGGFNYMCYLLGIVMLILLCVQLYNLFV